ncbi:MAG TPA: hypothetical protein VHZ03_02885 [Trebonia sp.]|nr:hypothetical protein [Trebonia sp.]
MIIFTTGDAWRLYGNESAVRFVTLTVIIFAMGMVAMITAVMQLEGGWRQTADKAGNSETEVSESAKKTPARNLVTLGATPIDADLWYMKLVRINVRFMFWLTLILALFSIALITFMLFVFIGMVAVSAGATQDLLQSHSIDTISKWTFLGQTFVLTRPLLLLSVLFGCVAALTFATASLQDERSLNRFLQFALHYHRRSLSALDFYLRSIADLQQHLSWQTVNSKLEDHNRTEILRIFQMTITQAPPRVIATVFTMVRRRNFDSWAGGQGLAILNEISDHKFAKVSTEDLDFVLASAAAVPAQATVIQSIQHRMEIRASSKRHRECHGQSDHHRPMN